MIIRDKFMGLVLLTSILLLVGGCGEFQVLGSAINAVDHFGLSGVEIIVTDASGEVLDRQTTGNDGLWGFLKVGRRARYVTASKEGWVFDPEKYALSGESANSLVFEGTELPVPYSVSGAVHDAQDRPIPNATLIFSGGDSGSTVAARNAKAIPRSLGAVKTDSLGHWEMSGLIGTATVTVSKAGWVFEPSSRAFTGTAQDVQFCGSAPVTQIAVGYDQVLSIRADGTIWTWGWNPSGQLGDGTTNNSNTPVQVVGLTGAIKVDGGDTYSVALRGDGTVWAWGGNDYGQLGNGETVRSTVPVRVAALDHIVDISVGMRSNLALKADGTVWAWGYIQEFNYCTPFKVEGLSHVIAISSGGSHFVALKSDGSVWTWGRNDNGQLGDGTYVSKTVPVQIGAFANAVAVFAGGAYTMVIKRDGSIWACGDNVEGQLGIDYDGFITVPIQVPGITDVRSISAGTVHALAVKADGTLWAWGENLLGQLGLGDCVNRKTPTQVAQMEGVVQVAASKGYGVYPEGFSVALKDDGSVWAWGFGYGGALGNGSNDDSNVPVEVLVLP